MKVYYAHCVNIYGSEIEAEDIKLLEKLGFEVFNPNQPIHEENYRKTKSETGDGMVYFENLVAECEALAFRAMSDSRISAGCYREILKAKEIGIPVIEIPCLNDRSMTIEETIKLVRS